MTARFNPTACLKAAFLVGASALLMAQTTVTQPAAKKPAGFSGKQDNSNFVLTPMPDFSPKSLRKDRCDEKPRPADCDVKF